MWKTPDDLAQLAITQRRILATAAGYLQPGGHLLYATCSTSLAENEAVVADFLSSHREFMLERVQDVMPILTDLATPEGYFRSWPHRHGMDGFFAARLRKIT